MSANIHKGHVGIFGLACRAPGQSFNPEQLYQNLLNSKDCRAVLEDSGRRVPIASLTHDEKQKLDLRRAQYLITKDICFAPVVPNEQGYPDPVLTHFDAPFFKITEEEAQATDPQQRLLLEVAYEAIHDAGLTFEKVRGRRIAVYAVNFGREYQNIIERAPEQRPTYAAIGTSTGIQSSRVSYHFDWKGPCLTLDTACSSGLVALDLARRAILSGEAEGAMVLGANLILNDDITQALDAISLLSPSGTSKVFCKDADGYARGEAIAAVLLLPPEEDSSTIAGVNAHHLRPLKSCQAVIVASKTANEGRTAGITCPSDTSQSELIQSTYKQANISIEDTTYWECHGTGTQLGDKIEVSGLRDSRYKLGIKSAHSPLFVGSIKSCIGHSEPVAGLMALIKVVISMKYGVLPPNQNFASGFRKDLGLQEAGLVPVECPTQFPRNRTGEMQASINSFGFGGTISHLIVQSVKLREEPAELPKHLVAHSSMFEGDLGLLSIWTDTLSKIPEISKRYMQLIEAEERAEGGISVTWMRDLIYTSQQQSRLRFKARIPCLLNDPSTLKHKIANLREEDFHIEQSKRPKAKCLPIWIFTGQGAQWIGMGRKLLSDAGIFKKVILHCDQILSDCPEPPAFRIVDEILKADEISRIMETEISQVVCTAIQLAVVILLDSVNIQPFAGLGHSSGEIACAYACGLLTFSEAIVSAYLRGKYMCKTTQAGAMLAAKIPLEQAEQLTSKGAICIGCINSKQSITFSGNKKEVEALHSLLKSRNIICKLLPTKTAYHSHHMTEVAPSYLHSLRLAWSLQSCSEPRTHASIQLRRQAIPMFSSTTSHRLTESEVGAEYWIKNMTSVVRFPDALSKAIDFVRETAIEQDQGIAFVEIGPHSALKGPVRETFQELLKDQELNHRAAFSYIGTLENKTHDSFSLLTAINQLVYLCLRDSLESTVLVALPSAAKFRSELVVNVWDRRKAYWHAPATSKRRDLGFTAKAEHDILGFEMDNRFSQQQRIWQVKVKKQNLDVLRFILEAAKETQGRSHWQLENVTVVEPDLVNALPESEISIVTLFSSRTGTIQISYEDEGGPVIQIAKARVKLLRTAASIIQPAPGGNAPDEETRVQPPFPLHEGVLEDILIELGLRNHLQAKYNGQELILRSTSPTLTDIGGHYLNFSRFLPLVIRLTFAFFLPGRDTFRRYGIRSLSLATEPTQKSAQQTSLKEFVSIACCSGNNFIIFWYNSQQIIALNGLHLEDSTSDACWQGNLVWYPTIDQLDPPPGSLDTPKEHLGSNFQSLCCDVELLAVSYFTQALRTVRYDQVVNYDHRLYYRWMQQKVKEVNEGQHSMVTANALDEGMHPENFSDLLTQIAAKETLYQHSVGSVPLDRTMIQLVGENLEGILTGRIDALECFTRNGFLERYYECYLNITEAYDRLNEVIELLSLEQPDAHYCEIGAGTGGATMGVLRTLASNRPDCTSMGASGANHIDPADVQFGSYTYTDISPGFFARARERFRAWLPWMNFKVLDIEKKEETRSPAWREQYDVVVAVNVLHATTSLQATVCRAAEILKPGGHLVLLEMTNCPIRAAAFAGLLRGWWFGKADGRSTSPTVGEEQWLRILSNANLTDTKVIRDHPDPKFQVNSVFISRKAEAVAVNVDKTNLERDIIQILPGLSRKSARRPCCINIGALRIALTLQADVTETMDMTGSDVHPETLIMLPCPLDEKQIGNLSNAICKGLSNGTLYKKLLLFDGTHLFFPRLRRTRSIETDNSTTILSGLFSRSMDVGRTQVVEESPANGAQQQSNEHTIPVQVKFIRTIPQWAEEVSLQTEPLSHCCWVGAGLSRVGDETKHVVFATTKSPCFGKLTLSQDDWHAEVPSFIPLTQAAVLPVELSTAVRLLGLHLPERASPTGWVVYQSIEALIDRVFLKLAMLAGSKVLYFASDPHLAEELVSQEFLSGSVVVVPETTGLLPLELDGDRICRMILSRPGNLDLHELSTAMCPTAEWVMMPMQHSLSPFSTCSVAEEATLDVFREMGGCQTLQRISAKDIWSLGSQTFQLLTNTLWRRFKKETLLDLFDLNIPVASSGKEASMPNNFGCTILDFSILESKAEATRASRQSCPPILPVPGLESLRAAQRWLHLRFGVSDDLDSPIFASVRRHFGSGLDDSTRLVSDSDAHIPKAKANEKSLSDIAKLHNEPHCQHLLTALLTAKVAATFGVDLAALDVYTTLADLGVDSLVSAFLVNWMQTELRTISFATGIKDLSIHELSTTILEHLKEETILHGEQRS